MSVLDFTGNNSFSLKSDAVFTKYSISTYPIGDIRFVQKDLPAWKYAPKDDITNKELALLFPLFAIGSMSQNYCSYDFRGYIEKNGLLRHFEEV